MPTNALKLDAQEGGDGRPRQYTFTLGLPMSLQREYEAVPLGSGYVQGWLRQRSERWWRARLVRWVWRRQAVQAARVQ